MRTMFALHPRGRDRRKSSVHELQRGRPEIFHAQETSATSTSSQKRLVHARREGIRTVSMHPLRYVDPDCMTKLSTRFIHETMRGRFSLQGTTKPEPYRHRVNPNHRTLTSGYAKPYGSKSTYTKSIRKKEPKEPAVASKSRGTTQDRRGESVKLDAGAPASLYTQVSTANRQRPMTSIHKREKSNQSSKPVHTDIERPYICPMCEKRYGTLSAVSMHLRLKHERIVRIMLGLNRDQEMSSHHGRSVAGLINNVQKSNYLVAVCTLKEAIEIEQKEDKGAGGGIEEKEK